MLRVRNVTVEKNRKRLIDNVSFDVEAGEILGIIGPNGAGKSTLLHVLTGWERKKSGNVSYHGTEIEKMTSLIRAQTVSLLAQDERRPNETVEQYIALARYPHTTSPTIDEQIIETQIDRFALHRYRSVRCTTLSGGEWQRVRFAHLAAQQTPYVLLDEPTTYMDIGAQQQLYEQILALKNERRAVVVVLHDLVGAATYCDRLLLLQKGRVVLEGTPEDVLQREPLERVYRVLLRRVDEMDLYYTWRDSHGDLYENR